MKVHVLARCILSVVVSFAGLCASQAQTISYIIPDIGAPGMNIMVELVAPYDAVTSFGNDGFYTNNPGDLVRVLCADPDDTNRVTIGPVVVSWDGRLISTQIFVHPDQNPGSSYWYSVGAEFEIPLQVYVNGNLSNAEIFYIVRPQPPLFSTLSGEIGSGGVWGLRSKRGAMIVDSIELSGPLYTISTMDPDANIPGNQGYLPAIILSKGVVRTGPSSVIQVNASGKFGGPGGGGGGGNFCDWSGNGTDGGDGFTGGGPGGRNKAGNFAGSDEYRNPGNGSGSFIGRTGGSLNEVPGGDSPAYESSGGGTGHPFGKSGNGCDDGGGCNPPGGYGGGSGQQQTYDGGAGGYATQGQSSRNDNGGNIYGNDMIVPLAGGSGGASGNPQFPYSCSGDGGGGGGALRLFGRSIEASSLTSKGGDGTSGSSSNGGAGSGGAISVEAKLTSTLVQCTAPGGSGSGPKGGAGRLRVDGPFTSYGGSPSMGESLYFGPSTDTTTFVSKRFRLTGSGNGNDITLYIKSARSPWSQLAVITGYNDGRWSQDIVLNDGDGVYFITALQATELLSSDRFLAVPSQIMSQSAANIIFSETSPHIVAQRPAPLPDLRCSDETYDTLYIGNIGDKELSIVDLYFTYGDRGFTVVEPTVFPIQIQENDSIRCVVRFTRQTGVTGTINDVLRIESNDGNQARNPLDIPMEIVVEQVTFAFDLLNVRMPDVILCQSALTDTTLTLRNTGTVTVSVNEPSIVGSSVTLLQPPASTFPRVLPPGGAVDISLRMSHSIAGTQTAIVTFTSDSLGCYSSATVSLTGVAGEANPMLEIVPMFPALTCFGEQALEQTTLRNDGDVNITVQMITTDNDNWDVAAPVTPFVLAPSEVVDIELLFMPKTTGVQQGVLQVQTEPCSKLLTVPLRGRRDSVGAMISDISFGAHHISELPLLQNARVVNTGDNSLSIVHVPVASPFELLTQLPITLQPGDTADVVVRLNDSMGEGNWSYNAAAITDPFCDSVRFIISGDIGDAVVEILVGDAQAAAGDEFTVNLYLRNTKTPELFGATSITSTLAVDASVLVPLFQPAGSVSGGIRRIPIQIPLIADAQGVAASYRFAATLGIAETSPMVLENSSPIGGRLTIIERPGVFLLLDLCNDGGVRLFDGSVKAGIHSNYPNPFNPRTEIVFATVEEGYTELYITDYLGRMIQTLYQGVPTSGVHTTSFEAFGLPSGVYCVILKTPTATYRKSILLSK